MHFQHDGCSGWTAPQPTSSIEFEKEIEEHRPSSVRRVGNEVKK